MLKIKREINIDNLDKYKNTDYIDWNSSCKNHKKIAFSYGDTTGIFKLIKYDSQSNKVTFCYLNNIYTMYTASLLKCNLYNITNEKSINKQKHTKEKTKRTLNNFTLYCHINKFNQKKYFGITSQIPIHRWQNGNGYKNNKYFYKSIKKYGWDNFYHVILYNSLSEKDASILEKEYIEKYDTCNKENGYNILPGGFNCVTSSESPLARSIYQFDLNRNLIKKWDCIKDAAKYLGNVNYSSDIIRAAKTETKYALNYLWSYDKIMISTFTPKQKIYEYDLMGNLLHTYNSITDIPNIYNKNKVRDCCNHVIKTHKNRLWIYENDRYLLAYYIRKSKYNIVNNEKYIGQYSTDNILLNCYVNIKEASELNNFSYQGIYKCCIGKTKISSGYIWKYITQDTFLEHYNNPAMRELKEVD